VKGRKEGKEHPEGKKKKEREKERKNMMFSSY